MTRAWEHRPRRLERGGLTPRQPPPTVITPQLVRYLPARIGASADSVRAKNTKSEVDRAVAPSTSTTVLATMCFPRIWGAPVASKKRSSAS